eukprot:3359242-Rhodomonas_salina.1
MRQADTLVVVASHFEVEQGGIENFLLRGWEPRRGRLGMDQKESGQGRAKEDSQEGNYSPRLQETEGERERRGGEGGEVAGWIASQDGVWAKNTCRKNYCKVVLYKTIL